MNKKSFGIVILLSLLLSGCGQSGALYLPPPPKPAKSMPSNQTPVQAVEQQNTAVVAS